MGAPKEEPLRGLGSPQAGLGDRWYVDECGAPRLSGWQGKSHREAPRVRPSRRVWVAARPRGAGLEGGSPRAPPPPRLLRAG